MSKNLFASTMCLTKDYTRQNFWSQGTFMLIEEKENVRVTKMWLLCMKGVCTDSLEREVREGFTKKKVSKLSLEGRVCQVI